MYGLLTQPQDNTKIKKNLAHGVATFALHLAPGDLSGFEVCASRSVGCFAGCLNEGRKTLYMPQQAAMIQRARIMRTKWYFHDRDGFMAQLYDDIANALIYAGKKGMQCAIRLNATSDIPWHRIPLHTETRTYANMMEAFSSVQFYDYTKVAKRLLKEELPHNYHLTFSLSEDNELSARLILARGHNVAIVLRDKKAVERTVRLGMWGVDVVNGDEHDLRYLDPRGVIVALSAKNRAKADASGWVRDFLEFAA